MKTGANRRRSAACGYDEGRRLGANGDAGSRHVLLGFADGVGAEVEDGGGEHGAGVAVLHAIDEMVERADAARGDDRNGDGVGDGARQGEVEAGLGAVAIHGGEQDLAGAERHDLLRA